MYPYYPFNEGKFSIQIIDSFPILHYENMPIQIYWKFCHQKW